MVIAEHTLAPLIRLLFFTWAMCPSLWAILHTSSSAPGKNIQTKQKATTLI